VTLLTTAYHQVVFIEKKRKVWSHSLHAYEWISYFRLVMIDDYNHFMDGVDLQDQLRWYYRIDGKRMWRWRRWTWAVYRWLIDTRCVNAHILHTLLVKKDLTKWTDIFDSETAYLTNRNSQTRSHDIDQIELQATAKANRLTGLVEKPAPLTQKDFRIKIVLGLLGKLQSLKKRGRPSSSSSSSSSSTKSSASVPSPDRSKRQKKQQEQAFNSSTKGNKFEHQYPSNSQGKGGKGLDPKRLQEVDLKFHRALDFTDEKGDQRSNSHVCQVCSAVGPIWKKKGGVGAARGGTAKPRRAKILCIGESCPSNYCSCACFNLYHFGPE